MAAEWTLSSIQQAIRKVTGRFTPSELSNAELTNRINQFYTLIFPAEVKLDKKLVYYQFTTTANQAYYDVPQTSYTNFQPVAYCNNFPMNWYQSPDYFQAWNPNQYNFLTPWTGDGSTAAFSTTLQTGFPVMPGTLTISDTVELFEDSNTDWTTSNVTISGSLGGSASVNYDTGSVSVTFNTAPADGQVINVNYVLFTPNRPQGILFFNNQFQLYPVPDQQYIVKMKAYSVVPELVNATDTPELNEWGRCIVYGTARDILADYGELDGYAEITALYKEQVSYILTRTAQDLMNVRALPQF